MVFFKKKKDQVILKKGGPARRKEEDREIIMFSRLVFYFLAAVFLGVAVYIFLFSSFARIKNVSVRGNETIAEEEIRKSVREFISGKYLKIIAADNYILVSKNNIAGLLEERFKKIKKAEAEKVFPDTINFEIEERESLILWCSGGPCYIIDDQGIAYGSVDLDAPEVIQNNLIKLVNSGAQPVAVGEKILDTEYVSFILRLREELGKNHIAINDEWKTPSQVASDVVVETQEGWNIYFSSKTDAAKSLRTLKTFLSEEIKENVGKLEYADLRAENKVYYKFKQEENNENQPQE